MRPGPTGQLSSCPAIAGNLQRERRSSLACPSPLACKLMRGEGIRSPGSTRAPRRRVQHARRPPRKRPRVTEHGLEAIRIRDTAQRVVIRISSWLGSLLSDAGYLREQSGCNELGLVHSCGMPIIADTDLFVPLMLCDDTVTALNARDMNRRVVRTRGRYRRRSEELSDDVGRAMKSWPTSRMKQRSEST